MFDSPSLNSFSLGIEDHFCLEIFCGQAKLSAALRARGFQVFSVDHKAQRGIAILQLDVSVQSQRQLAVDLLRHPLMFYAHFAPPCGTASSARSIPLPQLQHPPEPLRSLEEPLGLASLTGLDLTRVTMANSLYSFTALACVDLHAEQKLWSVENPGSSLMWVHPDMQKLSTVTPLYAIAFHTCMFGAERRKETAIWANVQEFSALERCCDEKHSHQPWGLVKSGSKRKFATTEECAYNKQLAAAWADVVVNAALNRGLAPKPTSMLDVTPQHARQHQITNKAVLGMLPRGKTIPPLLTDLMQPAEFVLPNSIDPRSLTVGARIPDNKSFPAGTKLLRLIAFDKNGGNDEEAMGCGKSSGVSAVLGIPREPLDYLAEVCKLVHPVVQQMRVPEVLTQSMMMSAGQIADVRAKWARRALDIIKDLAGAEKELHSHLPNHAQKILKRKRLLFFKRQLELIDYPDAKIADEMAAGHPLFGWLDASNVFPPCLRPPQMHPDCLRAMAPSVLARTIAVTKPGDDPAADEALWSATMKEVSEGFANGPYLRPDLPEGVLASPRFGLMQKNKLRPIDNFSASSVNHCTGLPEKLRVQAVDEAAAMVKHWAKTKGKGTDLVGKTYDLRKAYRQLAVREDHLDFAWIAVCDSSGTPNFFRLNSMPFGATASVAAFLRVAEAIKQIGLACLGLVWTSFFDDFIVICEANQADATDRCVMTLFRLLGWDVAEDLEKNQPFAKTFQALGVVIDLRPLHDGHFCIGNTQSRKEELTERINLVLEVNRLSPGDALSLRSRLLFAESQIFGRTAKRALQIVGEIGLGTSVVSPLPSQVVLSLEWLRDRVLQQPPRRIRVDEAPTLNLFLDGACEGDEGSKTSIGGLLCDTTGRGLACFGEVVPEEIVDKWSARGVKQLIFEAELLPYVISMQVFADHIRSCNLLVFVDNEAARYSWIAASAHSDVASFIVSEGARLEADLAISPYFCRVPTHSNLADGPSRDDFELCFRLGATRIRVPRETLVRYAAPK